MSEPPGWPSRGSGIVVVGTVPGAGEADSVKTELILLALVMAGTRFRRLMTVFFIVTGRETPCSL